MVPFGDSNSVADLDSFGLKGNCKGVHFNYRAGIENAHKFIEPFLE